ncbi:hypothetical protein HDU99_004853, partial [Rhizoclosmatium hyalinum]
YFEPPEHLTSKKYRLHAVLQHEGEAGFGHYRIYIRNHESTSDSAAWFLYDDSRVSLISKSVVDATVFKDTTGLTANAYCLMYVEAEKLIDIVQTFKAKFASYLSSPNPKLEHVRSHRRCHRRFGHASQLWNDLHSETSCKIYHAEKVHSLTLAEQEWTQPLTSTALNSVCTNLQTDLNLFSTCVGGLCNSTDLLKNQQLLTLVPTGCRYIGFNTTGIVLPDLAPLVPKATATAAATTKSGAFEMFYIGATTDQVALVSKYLDTLPVCDIACLQTLPEWISPLTADAFVSVCKNLSVDLNQFATCAVSRCTASDIAGVKVLLPLVKEGCNYLGIDVSNVAIPDLTAVVTGSVTAIATSTVPANAVATTQAIATATGVAGSDPLAIANSIIAGLPACAQTCLSKLPEWTSQDNITIAAITTACNNLQADVNIF